VAIYVVEARPNVKDWDNPYDKVFGVVVRAKNSKEARKLAAGNAGDEGEEVWIDTKKTACRRLDPEGPSTIVMTEAGGS